MLEGVAPGAYVQGGAALVLLLVTVTLVRMALSVIRKVDSGELVPRSTLDTLRTQYEERIRDTRADAADRIRDARQDAADWRTVAQETGRQLGIIAEGMETLESFIRALRERTGRTP